MKIAFPAARRLVGGIAVVALAGGLLLAPAPNGSDEAQARPQHLKFFGQKYEDALGKDAIKKGRCDICHEKTLPKDKKIRNPYGAALADIVKENEKDQDAFNAALDKVADMSSCVPDKSYGDRIKDGQLPAEGCAPVKPDEKQPLVPVPDANN